MEIYLGLIHLQAKFDPLMQDHISRILKGELADHYCVKNILKNLLNQWRKTFILK
jgi:hypothetical protein